MSQALSDQQKKLIAQRIDEGASLSEIQKIIKSEFGVSMTYMDVRFLVDDLNLTLKDKTPPVAQPAEDTDAISPDAGETSLPAENMSPPAGGAGRVTVNVDPVQRPGVALGGTVTFSDGKVGQWQLDGYGQLGFVPPSPGYKPAPADVQEFQIALQKELAKLGYA